MKQKRRNVNEQMGLANSAHRMSFFYTSLIQFTSSLECSYIQSLFLLFFGGKKAPKIFKFEKAAHMHNLSLLINSITF